MEMGGWRYAFIWSPTADLNFALIHFQYITEQFCEKNVSTLDFVLADHFARLFLPTSNSNLSSAQYIVLFLIG